MSAVLFVVVVAGLGALVVKNRNDAIHDATVSAGNLASIMAEQVDHAMDALDTSLRTTARIVSRWPAADFDERASRPGFVEDLKSERISLQHADLMAITNDAGVVIGGSHGDRFARIDVSDRTYFKTLRDEPQRGLVVSEPLVSRATGVRMIFLARRLVSREGRFLGIAFLGVEPWRLIETAHPFDMIDGQSFGLFDDHGGLLLRRPNPVKHGDAGSQIEASSPWHKIAAQGGGLYRSEGYFDGLPKYVAVRPLPDYPLVVSVAITENAALAKWRTRSTIQVGFTAAALIAIGSLLYAQLALRKRLNKSRLRSWLRARRLSSKRAELRNVDKRFGLTLDYMVHGMAIFDAEGRLIVSNRSYAEFYDIDPARLQPGMGVEEIFDLRIAAGAYAGAPEEYRKLAFSPPFADRTDHLGNGRVLLIHTKRTDEGGWVTMQEDVTERFRTTERLSHMALHDGLTDLPNRAAFRRHIEKVAKDLDADQRLAVLLVDIDGFKFVNDSYGHDVGDAVLIEVAARLRNAAPNCFIARLGGDEFLVSARIAGGADGVAARIEHLMREIRLPMSIGGRHISLGFCIGGYIVDDGRFEVAHILRRADLALVEAKEGGRDRYRIFNLDMESRFDQRSELAGDLREAVEKDQFELHYQPIVTAAEQKIVCMEALVRWRHPVKGMVSPAVFIPLAEETGVILQLGDWVMRRACADAAQWPADIAVAVNVSSLQIAHPDFADSVQRALEQTGLEPGRLQIEITESVLLQDNRQTATAILDVHALGVTFALDDFGTGYASLAYLKRFPLDKVKIDKSFVDDICSNPQSIAIVGAVVTLARGLGVVTTAEGVETREQYEALTAIGVATIQGYYFGKPRPISEQPLVGRCERAA